MGYGEYIGGGSVHWRVVHEEYEEGPDYRRDADQPEPRGLAEGARTIAELPKDQEGAAERSFRFPTRKTIRARLRTANVPENKPAEHIANLDVLDYEARGKDTITYDQIGRCAGSKDHRGRFRLTMRFKDKKDAEAAARAAQRIGEEDGMFVLRLDVPVIQRDDQQVGPPPDPPAEVRIDW